MMLASPLLIAHLWVAQVNVVVTLADGTTIEDSTPAKGATVHVIRDGIEITKSKPTNELGEATLVRKQFEDTDELRALKPGYKGSTRDWGDVAHEDPIHLKIRKRQPKTLCPYTEQKQVSEIGRDGIERCRVVYETKYRECTQPGPVYLLPETPPPQGYKYEFAYAVTRWDALKQMYASRPYWRIVPACPQVGFIPYYDPQPCGCQ